MMPYINEVFVLSVDSSSAIKGDSLVSLYAESNGLSTPELFQDEKGPHDTCVRVIERIL